MTANQTRAVLRQLQRGQWRSCAACQANIKGNFKIGSRQATWIVIANVFSPNGSYNCRVMFYHPECYEALGQPHGPPDSSVEPRR